MQKIHPEVLSDFLDITDDQAWSERSVLLRVGSMAKDIAALHRARAAGHRTNFVMFDRIQLEEYGDELTIIAQPLHHRSGEYITDPLVTVFANSVQMKAAWNAMIAFIKNTRMVKVTLLIQQLDGADHPRKWKWNDLIGSEFRDVIDAESVYE